MIYTIGGQVVLVDNAPDYRYAVLEGDRPPVTFQRTREAAEAVVEEMRRERDDAIAKFSRALKEPETYREPKKGPFGWQVRDYYGSDAEIYAAIMRIRRTRDSIRVVELEKNDGR